MVDVSSDAPTIIAFAMGMLKPGSSLPQAKEPLAQTQHDASTGFMTMSPEYGKLGEAAVIMEVLELGYSDFTAFLNDVDSSLVAMHNAAVVVADTYATTDNTNGDDVNVVDFAFADPLAQRPKGLSTDLVGNQTMEQYDQAQQAKIPLSTTMSPSDPRVRVSHAPGGEETTYVFPDGSTMIVSSYPIGGVNGPLTTVQQTRVYDKNNNEVPDSYQEEDVETGPGYTTTTRVEQASGATVKTVTTQHKDGSSDVTRYVDGKQQGATEHVAPPPKKSSTDTDDPLAQGEQQYGSYGSDDGVNSTAGSQYKPPVRPGY